MYSIEHDNTNEPGVLIAKVPIREIPPGGDECKAIINVILCTQNIAGGIGPFEQDPFELMK